MTLAPTPSIMNLAAADTRNDDTDDVDDGGVGPDVDDVGDVAAAADEGA